MGAQGGVGHVGDDAVSKAHNHLSGWYEGFVKVWTAGPSMAITESRFVERWIFAEGPRVRYTNTCFNARSLISCFDQICISQVSMLRLL